MPDTAFTAFFEATRAPFLAYLRKVSGNPALAEDLLQDAYLRFLERPPDSAEPGPRRVYLFAIGHRLLVDHGRRASLRRWLPFRWGDEDEGPEEPACPDPGPDALARGREEVALGFSALPPRQRDLLWLAYVEGLDHAELAQVFDVSPASVKVLLHRARTRMARTLQVPGVLAGATP